MTIYVTVSIELSAFSVLLTIAKFANVLRAVEKEVRTEAVRPFVTRDCFLARRS
jgi:hypothetical protein